MPLKQSQPKHFIAAHRLVATLVSFQRLKTVSIFPTSSFDFSKWAPLWKDLQKALQLSPNDSSLLAEEAELRDIQDKTPEELQTWLNENKGVKLPLAGMNASKVKEDAEKLRSFVEFGPA